MVQSKKTQKTVKAVTKTFQKYTPELWTTIQSMFESGKFTSIESLHKTCTTIFPRSPSLDAIKKRAGTEKWDKSAQKEAIEEEKTKNFRELFSELGLDDKRTAQVIVDGVLCFERTQAKIMEMFKEAGPDILADPEQMLNLSGLLRELFSNQNTAHRYLETKLKLSGNNPTERKNITLKDESEHKLIKKFTDMTDDEIEGELNRIRSVMTKK
jgi:hypothetical protein